MTPSPKISSQQAHRAITIDFEGNMERAPSLIGIHVDGRVRHFILEPQLGPLTSLTNRNYVVERSDLEWPDRRRRRLRRCPGVCVDRRGSAVRCAPRRDARRASTRIRSTTAIRHSPGRDSTPSRMGAVSISRQVTMSSACTATGSTAICPLRSFRSHSH